MNRTRLRIVSVVLAFGLPFASCSEKSAKPLAAAAKDQKSETIKEESPLLVVNGELNGSIAREVGRMLERYHYSRQPLDDTLSKKFLERYLDLLDYNRLFFIQADLDEFNVKYGATLDDSIKRADASPAFEMFQRFLQRVEERGALVSKLLKEKIDFTADLSYVANRTKEPWPKDLEESTMLWRARIKDDILQGRLNKEKTDEVVDRVSRRYARFVKNTRSMDERKILDTYLSALSQAYDPHSDYLDPETAKEFENEIFKQSFTGIGAELKSEDGYSEIVRLVPGGPADLDKRLKPGDRIIAVAQGDGEPVDVVDMPLPNVVKLIRGEKGTIASLTIIPASATDKSVRVVIKLKRDEVKRLDTLAQGQLIDHKGEGGVITRVGIITLPEFYARASRDIQRLVEYMRGQGVHGLILDLRRNPGGLLPEATKLGGLFVKSGVITQVKGYLANDEVDMDDSTSYDGPLIVMVSRWSASASEIVAAALQDYNRALIVGGQATHGKGTVQKLDELNTSGQIKITVQKFYRVSGGSTQFKGVISDIILPSVLDASDRGGESSLPHALPYDEVSPVRHDSYNLVAPYLETLRQRSAARLAKNPDFQYIQQDMAFFRKLNEEKTVSLQEAKRQKEAQEMKVRVEARDLERASRVPSGDRIWKVTLDNLDKKQAPAEITNVKGDDINDPEALQLDSGTKDKANKNAPKIDVQMQETLNIMADYVDLWSKGQQRTVATKEPVAAH
jgi:carboxyl-terminal processing protease